jgi:3-deoxy-D-manno-octulosonate 8-phosphate phosphatase (KDO 8-P phosphatase)
MTHNSLTLEMAKVIANAAQAKAKEHGIHIVISIYDNHGNELKKFNVKDGQIISHVKQAGLIIGAITGRESEVVKFRCRELNFDFHYHGTKDKLSVYKEIKQKYNLSDHEVAYLGDDIIDIPILSACGLGIIPSDAVSYISDYANLITFAQGGKGVLREAADFILAAQGKLKEVVEYYLNKQLSI